MSDVTNDDSDTPIQWRTDDESDSDSEDRENRRSTHNHRPTQNRDYRNGNATVNFPSPDPRFMQRDKWVNDCFMAIRRGNLKRVIEVFHPNGGAHPSSINHHMFNMGFPVGAGGTMKLPSSSTALHVAAWCGQSDIVRWLLNNGASASERDGLHQLPVEVASTLDVKKVLGAASGIINISDKMERVESNLTNDITLVGDQFAIRLARIQGELGEIDFKIEKAVREAAREEVLELRAALARKLARELKRFARNQTQVKTDPMVWQKINKLERYQVDINNLHKYVDEIKDDMDKRPMTFGMTQDDGGEVEASSTDSTFGSNGKKELKRLQKALDKNEKVIRMKGKVIDGLTEEIDALHSRMERLEIAHKSNQGCCVVS
tara:strand:+ start:59 stop:1186 length:1128 start_codon:yes stop_codon:yes gene_type:complete